MTETAGIDTIAAPPFRREWLVEVEGLRGIAFVLIVFGHAAGVLAFIPHGVATMAVFGVLLALSRFALLAFMTMSSILIAHRVAQGKPANTGRNLRRLALPYVVWTVFYLLVSKVLEGGPATTMDQVVHDLFIALLTGSGFYHLWYVLVAIQIVAVTPPLARALLRLTTGERLYVFGIVLAANMVLLGQVAGPVTEWAPWTTFLFGGFSDRIVLFWFAYVTAGVIIGLEYDRAMRLLASKRLLLWSAYGICSVALVGLVVAQSISVGGDYQAVADISRVLQAWIVPFELLAIVVWLDASSLMMRVRARDWASRLSMVSFGGYLVHPLWILVATQYVYSRVVAPYPSLFVIALTAFALSASYLTVVYLARLSTPLGTALFGAVSGSHGSEG